MTSSWEDDWVGEFENEDGNFEDQNDEISTQVPPSLLNFNGRLLNSDGEPVTGEVFVFLRVFLPWTQRLVNRFILSKSVRSR